MVRSLIRRDCILRSLDRRSSGSSSIRLLKHALSTIAVPNKDVVVHKTASSSKIDSEREGRTALVDSLLERTEKMMEIQKHNITHTIAYSGGVDSSLVAALVYKAGQKGSVQVQAVMGLSPAVPMEQRVSAEKIAEFIGIPFSTVPTYEGSNEAYIANQGKACLACKTELYSTLEAIANHTSQDNLNHQLYNGTNADDLQDTTRLGLIAATNFKVLSPLSLTTKAEVRMAAMHLGLPNWNAAASPCLRSRLALGVKANSDHLLRIERAERFVRENLHGIIDVSTNFRVRMLAKQQACLEIDADKLTATQSAFETAKLQWESFFLKDVAFASFRIRAFRSGSVAKTSIDHRMDIKESGAAEQPISRQF